MDPDRVGTVIGRLIGSPYIGFQFIWIPTESGRLARRNYVQDNDVFPIYMDPDRVGTSGSVTTSNTGEWSFPIYMDPDRVGTVEAGFGTRAYLLFPIYMDPDRVGTG